MAKRKSSFANSLGVTSNFKKAGTIPAKTLAVRTQVLTLKPRRYATTGRA